MSSQDALGSEGDPADLAGAAVPAVSVVMSVYNAEDYIESAVRSILAQTFTDFELILIDDGSSDRSVAIMSSLGREDPRIRLIRQENTGLTRALIRGVDAARAPLIARMDADDLSLPARLERQVALMAANPALIATSSHIGFISAEGLLLNERDFLAFPKEVVRFTHLFGNSFGGHGQMMFRKAIYERAGGYDPDFRYAQDYDLWDRMMAFGDIGQVDETLYQYRFAGNSITEKHWAGQQECRFRVSRRAYLAMTGLDLGAVETGKVGEFWYGKGDVALGGGDLVAVSRIMQTAFRAWRRTYPSPEAAAAISEMVGTKFLERAVAEPIGRPLTILLGLLLALRWRPRLAGRAAKRMLSRLAGGLRHLRQ